MHLVNLHQHISTASADRLTNQHNNFIFSKQAMPFCIAVYDVNQKRVGKMLKLFRRYLTWVQNSVFEGDLTPAQLKQLQLEANALLKDNDGVVFYQLRDERYVERIALGTDQANRSRFL